MKIIPFKAAFPKVELITSPDSFFSNIKYQYREYRKSGFYQDSEDAGLYVYQIINAYGKHTGLICNTDVSDLKKGFVLKHEKTLASKEQQMMHLILQRKALVKPVLLGYNPIDKIQAYLKSITKKSKPFVEIKFEDGTVHMIWNVEKLEAISKIVKSFSKLKSAYIGDGHHRTTTVALLSASKNLGSDAKKYSQLLTAYFPFKELKIFDFNRVVDITDVMPSSRFMALLSTYFDITPLKKAQKPTSKHMLTFFIDSIWYKMKWKKKYIDVKNKSQIILDSALINKYIFGKILGINDVRIDSRIKYFGGTSPMRKLIKQAQKYGVGVGICIFPVDAKELTTIADQKKTLPPKSTWFEPRLVSGIVTKDL